MALPTVRLSEATKSQALSGLFGHLDNIVRFVECPVQDRATFINMWHSLFPQDYIHAHEVIADYGCQAGGGLVTEALPFGITLDGSLYYTLVRMGELPPELPPEFKIRRPLSVVLKLPQTMYRPVHMGDKTYRQQCVELPIETMQKFLGNDLDDFLSWVHNSAKLFDDVVLARKACTDVIGMARSAGQLKRMVPDLIQYLPQHVRDAFEGQKRASQAPFDWATYPKAQIEVMLATLNKGQLLVGMNKLNRGNWSSEKTDFELHTWSRHAEWVK